jgi:ABC-type lipoprotein export system ATPase subunit
VTHDESVAAQADAIMRFRDGRAEETRQLVGTPPLGDPTR